MTGLFLRETWYYSRVRPTGFEPVTLCSQSRLKILYKKNFTSVSVVGIEPF